jgi:hypothetical protein
MKIESDVFQNNEKIPSRYTCDGINISPPLKISEIPSNTKTLVLISDYTDTPYGDWVYWVVFNIYVKEANSIEINENAEPGVNGINDFGSLGYGGPCPPSGTHRYFFKIYALDTELNINEGADKKQVEQAMQNHVLDSSQLIGIYSRTS